MKPLLMVLLAACTAGAPMAAAQSLTGEWDAEMSTPGGVRTFKIVFQTDGDKLTGTVKRQAGDVPLAGTVKGDTVTFSYTIDYNGNPLVLTVTAKAVGDTLKGMVNFGGAAEAEFSAKRAAGAPRAPPSY